MVFSHIERKKIVELNPDIHNAEISKQLGKRQVEVVTADINKKLISVKISISFGHDITGKINLKQKKKSGGGQRTSTSTQPGDIPAVTRCQTADLTTVYIIFLASIDDRIQILQGGAYACVSVNNNLMLLALGTYITSYSNILSISSIVTFLSPHHSRGCDGTGLTFPLTKGPASVVVLVLFYDDISAVWPRWPGPGPGIAAISQTWRRCLTMFDNTQRRCLLVHLLALTDFNNLLQQQYYKQTAQFSENILDKSSNSRTFSV